MEEIKSENVIRKRAIKGENYQIFNNEEFGEVRTAVVNNEPMFCLSDVCKALGLSQPSKVKERLNPKGVNTIPTLTRQQDFLLCPCCHFAYLPPNPCISVLCQVRC